MTKESHGTRGIAILGSTGSIGTSALDLVERLNAMPAPGRAGARRFRVVAISGNRRVDLLAQQIERFSPLVACIGDEESARALKARLGKTSRRAAGPSTRIVWGREGLMEVTNHPDASFVLAAIVGAAGLEPTFAAVSAGKMVGLANKEALVLAGDLMMGAARASSAVLLPVDSEHNALHQCLRGESIAEVRRLVLTASGGPFLSQPEKDLALVTPEEALAHPTWTMGRKISIDSATLMNKALEVIEAHHFFGVPADRISVVIHPQSTIHSMVEFIDGSFVCQLGATDMRHPIQYALTWPERCETPLAPVDLTRLASLRFEEPDRERFPCLGFGWRALQAGGTMPAALNAANEIAVEAFLERRIRFVDIPRIIEAVLTVHRPVAAHSLETILHADGEARRAAIEESRRYTAAGAGRTGGP